MRFDPKRYASVDEVQSARIRRVFDYWRDKATGGQIPRRPAIDPTELADVLSCLIIVEVIGDRFRYRLVGTEVAANAGGDFTGTFLDAPTAISISPAIATFGRVPSRYSGSTIGPTPTAAEESPSSPCCRLPSRATPSPRS